MTTLLAASSATSSVATEGDVKAFLSNLRAYMADLMGTDSANLAAVHLGLQSLLASTQFKTGAYAVVAGDRGKVLSCAGTFSLSLPDATVVGDGFAVGVVNTGTGTITIDPYLSQQIDGGAAVDLLGGQSLLARCDGTEWRTFGKGGVVRFNTRVGDVSLESTDVTDALGYSPVSKNMTHNAVGSLCFARQVSGAATAAGATISGASLTAVGIRIDATDGTVALVVSGGALSGTWRCLGASTYASAIDYAVTLWQRVS